MFSDLVHSLWILLTNASFGLLVLEGVRRKSVFYISLFSCLGLLSFALHCEETGICQPLSTKMHKRLQTADLGLSYFLFGVMLMTVLEIKMETTAKMVAAAFAAFITARDVFDLKFNVIGMLTAGAVLLMVDAIVNKRRFRAAWWRRLSLICSMAAAGALLFRALKSLWAIHGLFHLYYVSACYLVLLAERHKKSLAGSSGSSSASRAGGGGSTSRATPFTNNGAASATAASLAISSTPLKRKGAENHVVGGGAMVELSDASHGSNASSNGNGGSGIV